MFVTLALGSLVARQDQLALASTMAASTASPFAVPSPLKAINPTTTEHDFRFPRRPISSAIGAAHNNRTHTHTTTTTRTISTPTPATSANLDPASAPAHSRGSAGELRANLQDLRLDLAAHPGRLRATHFPALQDDLGRVAPSPEDMQREDPLTTQIWRFFAKTKQLLPNQERMENLSWRMMHIGLRKGVHEATEVG